MELSICTWWSPIFSDFSVSNKSMFCMLKMSCLFFAMWQTLPQLKHHCGPLKHCPLNWRAPRAFGPMLSSPLNDCCQSCVFRHSGDSGLESLSGRSRRVRLSLTPWRSTTRTGSEPAETISFSFSSTAACIAAPKDFGFLESTKWCTES